MRGIWQESAEMRQNDAHVRITRDHSVEHHRTVVRVVSKDVGEDRPRHAREGIDLWLGRVNEDDGFAAI
jgi:hypothetical protein